jgi:hypothetical protein
VLVAVAVGVFVGGTGVLVAVAVGGRGVLVGVDEGSGVFAGSATVGSDSVSVAGSAV